MNNFLGWLISGIATLFGAYVVYLKRRVTKAEGQAEKVQEELEGEYIKNKIYSSTNKIKDDLAQDKATLRAEKEEVVQSVSKIEGEELSEDVKKLAAEQSARATARAKRLQDRRK